MNQQLTLYVLCIAICASFISSQKVKAKGNEAHEQYNRGLAFYTGEGSSRDYARAHHFFKNSAGHGYGPAQYQLGLLHFRGHGIEQNYSRALHWFQLAANQGVLGSHHHIGRLHQNGLGVPRSPHQAIIWYSRSFEAGYRESLDPLAQLYLNNQTTALNDLGALLKSNAESGDTTSQYNLGYSYYIGHNVEKDHNKATTWFLQAAVQGDADAQAMLAKMYNLGEGVSSSPYHCYLWASVAATNDNEVANEHRDTCKEKLNQDELQRATQESEKLLAGFTNTQ